MLFDAVFFFPQHNTNMTQPLYLAEEGCVFEAFEVRAHNMIMNFLPQTESRQFLATQAANREGETFERLKHFVL